MLIASLYTESDASESICKRIRNTLDEGALERIKKRTIHKRSIDTDGYFDLISRAQCVVVYRRL